MQKEVKVPGYLQISKILGYIMYAWVFFGIIVLGLRVFLLAFSANATTPFVEFIYRTSADYLEPFRGIFPSKSIGETGYLDIAAIFAMIIYLLIGWGFSAFIRYIQSKIDDLQNTKTPVEPGVTTKTTKRRTT
jgi:uncharacterized protein YggT (Ycf19 family)